MRYAAISDVGRKRTLNEDGYIANGQLFAVADGMGGHRAGEVASSIALDTIRAYLSKRSRETARERLEGAVKRANLKVHDSAVRDATRRGMGTTLTVVVPSGGKLYIAHVGDSRLYVLRDGKLNQVTADHSLVAQMVQSGYLNEEEAEEHPHRNIITRAVGSEAEVDIDMLEEDILPGDRFLLCTDGLTSMLSDNDITQVLLDKEGLDEACRELVQWANDKGGIDNITVILFEQSSNHPSNRLGILRRFGL